MGAALGERPLADSRLKASKGGAAWKLVGSTTQTPEVSSDRTQLPHQTKHHGEKARQAKRRLAGGSPAMHIALVNGSAAVLAVVDDRVVGAVAFEVGDGKAASLRGIAAADRLARLNEAWRQHEPDAPVINAW